MEFYAENHLKCVKQFGQRPIGEDFYLRLCLKELGLHGVQELRLMVDAYAWDWNYTPCDMASAVYHPLKSQTAWARCAETVCNGTEDPWVGVIDTYGGLIRPSLLITETKISQHERR